MLFLNPHYRLKPVIKCLLISWRHYCTGRTTYKRILAAASQQTVCWQTLVRVVLSLYLTLIKRGSRNDVESWFVCTIFILYNGDTHFIFYFDYLPVSQRFMLLYSQRVKELLSYLK